MAITAEERSQIIALTVGMFGAAPGAAVLSELAEIVDNGTSISTLAEWLASSAEFRSLYPNFLTTEEFATNFINNLVGNEVAAADKEWAVDYITAELNSGRSRAEIIVEVLTALDSVEEDNELWGAAAARFNNQVEVATYYSVTAQRSGDSLEALQDVIDGVTSDDSTVESAKVIIDTGSNPGQTFTFTTGVDTVVGTNGDDIFNAGSNAAGVETLTALDSITGGNGTDTLYVIDVGAVTIPTTAKVTGVEIANIVSAAEVNGDVSGWTGLETLTVDATGNTAAQVITAGSTDVTFTNAVNGVGATTGGDITVNGGEAVVINNNLSQATTGTTTTGGTITVNGGAATTSVAVNQTAGVAQTLGTGAATETATVDFDQATTYAQNAQITVGGLTLTVNNALGLTGDAIAAAFANIAAGGAGTSVGGEYTFTGNLTGFSSAAVTNTDQLVFTSSTANSNVVDLAVAGGPTVTVSQGTAGSAGTKAIVVGDVNITDVNAASTSAAGKITTVSLTNFDDATVNSGALTTVNLAGKGATFNAGTLGALTTATATATVGLNLQGFTSTGAVTFDSDVKTLNVAVSSGNSTLASLATSATALNISGDKTLTLTAATVAATAAITSTNSAGVTIGSTLGTGVSFTGGAGKDTVTVGATTKAIAMGAGDDTVTLTGGVVGTAGTVAGGEGRDTLKLSQAEAAAASAGTAVANFTGKVTGFEILEVAATAGASTIDVANLNTAGNNAIDTVVFGGAVGHATTVTNLASGNTVGFKAANSAATTIEVKDALTNSADVINVSIASGATGINVNTINAANVETVNFLTSTSSSTATVQQTATLVDAAATTVTVAGNAGLALTFTGTKLTTFDASGVTKGAVDWTSGALEAAAVVKGGAGANTITFSAATKAVTYTGGAAVDTIVAVNAQDNVINTAAGNDVVTLGSGKNTVDLGAGNDTINLGSNLNVVTLGAGNDVVNAAITTNGNTYSTLTDFAKGDTISFAGISVGTVANGALGAQITLGSTAAFADFLNAAAAGDGGTNADVNWFQYAGDTYVVIDNSAANTYQNGVDSIIKLTGAIDLATATLTAEVLALP